MLGILANECICSCSCLCLSCSNESNIMHFVAAVLFNAGNDDFIYCCCSYMMCTRSTSPLSSLLFIFLSACMCCICFSDEIWTLDILYGRVLCLADYFAFISLKKQIELRAKLDVRIFVRFFFFAISYFIFHILLHSHTRVCMYTTRSPATIRETCQCDIALHFILIYVSSK